MINTCHKSSPSPFRRASGPPSLSSRDSAVRAFPPRQFRNSCVSLESRYLQICGIQHGVMSFVANNES